MESKISAFLIICKPQNIDCLGEIVYQLVEERHNQGFQSISSQNYHTKGDEEGQEVERFPVLF